MQIRVRLFATLRHGRGKELQYESTEALTPDAIIRKLEIDEKEVAILLINGRDGCIHTELSDGDVISIFPPVGGG